MNKTALVDEVKARLGLSTGRAKSVVDGVLAEIRSALAKGERVTLRGLGVLTRSSDGDGFDFTPAAGLTVGAGSGGTSGGRKVAAAKKAPGAKKAASATKTAPAKKSPAAKKAAPPAKKVAAAKKAAPPAKKVAAAKKASATKAAPPQKSAATTKRVATKRAATKRTATKRAATRPPTTTAPEVSAAPTEPQVVPYEPMHEPAVDALAAVAAEENRPSVVVEPEPSERIVATQPEPELIEQPDTVVYSSGDADTTETIGELTQP